MRKKDLKRALYAQRRSSCFVPSLWYTIYMPTLYIIAGPNGSGKTTFAKEFLLYYAKCSNFVNADLIALGLSPFSPGSVNIKAGKLLLKEIDQFMAHNVDFAFETTLSGKAYVSLFK